MSDEKKRILLVDDSKFLRRQLKKFLVKEGYDIVGDASNGIEGLSGFKEHNPDLVLLDITMPLRSGFDCLMDIMKVDNKAKVLMLSGISDMDTIEKCLAIGAKNYIQKPLDLHEDEGRSEFIDKIEQALI